MLSDINGSQTTIKQKGDEFMNSTCKTKVYGWIVTGSFLLMIIINALANILPINGVTTGDVSNSYANLFAPAAFTFTIWGAIYFLLGLYILYQWGLLDKDKNKLKKSLIQKISIPFIISSISNFFWIFAWHYNAIFISLILMIIILICLIFINLIIKKEKLTKKEWFFISVPFSVYFGWITIATVANITTWLVSIGWNGFGISEAVWTVFILLVAVGIGLSVVWRYKDIVYGLVFIWAYIGILSKHFAPTGFAGQYVGVIAAVIVSLVLLISVQGFLIINDMKEFFVKKLR